MSGRTAKIKSVHAVVTSIVFDRVPSSDLSDDAPQKNLELSNVRELVAMSESEISSISVDTESYWQTLCD